MVDMDRLALEESDSRFAAFIGSLNGVIGHRDRIGPFRDYCAGLLAGCERKERGAAGCDHSAGTVFGAASIAIAAASLYFIVKPDNLLIEDGTSSISSACKSFGIPAADITKMKKFARMRMSHARAMRSSIIEVN
jgi:hypothetical protein